MKNIKPKDVVHNWHLIDAKDKVLGRISTDIAKMLMGKNKSYYTAYLDTGDNVVVVNAAQVMLSGKKENQKVYYHHSGYPGGLYSRTASQIRAKRPEDLIRHSVVGMLPRTKLGKEMARKLHVYPGSEHPHQDKFKSQ